MTNTQPVGRGLIPRRLAEREPGQPLGRGASPLDAIYGVPIEDLNPDIKELGPGPEGARCGSCANLGATRVGTVGHDPSADQTIYYCLLNGQAKRVTWPACANFREAPLAYEQTGQSTPRIERNTDSP